MDSCVPVEEPLPLKEELPSDTSSTVAPSAVPATEGGGADERYSYTERGEFTSELNKVEIANLPRFCGYTQLKAFFTRYKLTPVKLKIVRSRPKESFAFATFHTSEEKQLALDRVNGEVLKGRRLVLKPAKPRTDPIFVAPLSRSADHQSVAAVPSEEEQTAMLLRAVTPLWDLPYPEQLERKLGDLRQRLAGIQGQLENKSSALTEYCPLDDVIASALTAGYRNKNEFTCGRDLQGRRCVGFRLGAYKAGSWSVAPPYQCIHVPAQVLRVVELCNQFVLESRLEVFDPRDHSGNWKQITVRSNQAEEMMVVLQVHGQGLRKEEVREECERLCKHLCSGASSELKVTSVYFQLCDSINIGGRSGEMELLSGTGKLTEKLMGVQFCISPNAFFQVNTRAAEALYDVIRQNIPGAEHTVLLDLCCGAGTIGLCLARHVDRVIGIEISQEAVIDAICNSESNNISNAKFVCGAVENKLNKLEEIYQESYNVVAVLDPPRAGVPSTVIRTLRKAKSVKRLIYVACSVSNASQNLVDICRPPSGRMPGEPFRPVRATPVDLFPHTLHCELVLCYDHVNSIVK